MNKDILNINESTCQIQLFGFDITHDEFIKLYEFAKAPYSRSVKICNEVTVDFVHSTGNLLFFIKFGKCKEYTSSEVYNDCVAIANDERFFKVDNKSYSIESIKNATIGELSSMKLIDLIGIISKIQLIQKQ